MKKGSLYISCFVSVAIHFFLVILIKFPITKPKEKLIKITKITLIERPKEKIKEDKKEEENERKQIVDLPPDHNAKKPKDPKYSSETNHETEKESVSRHRKPTDKPAHELSPDENKAHRPSQKQEQQERQEKQKGPRLKEGGDIPQEKREQPNLIPSVEDLLKIPPGSGGAPPPDAIHDVPEGEGTFLNTTAFKYASFFNRVKRDIASVWRPINGLRTVDPTGQLYMFKDRRTVVTVTLDKEGNLLNVVVLESSGVDILDREAIEAFKRCKQFPNPPAGLIENDKIVFNFGFEVTYNRGRILF